MASKRIGSQRIQKIAHQQGISLIPALLTICIFVALTTQVIIPNQIRDLNESTINAAANSAEKLIQATLAYRSVVKTSWPTTIGSNSSAGDLVPAYLPVFNPNGPWGEDWQIVRRDASGNVVTSGPADHITFAITTNSEETAKALVRIIGSHARTLSVGGKARMVDISPVTTGTPIVEDLTIKKDLTVVGNIILSGNIKTSGNNVIDSSKAQAGESTAPPIMGPKVYIPPHIHSSKRFKQNIQSLDIPHQSIYRLKPVSFDYINSFKQYKTSNAANREIGLIAEQVLPLIPEITLVNNDKVIGVDYQKLSILLLTAMQELKAEVASLEEDNQQFQQQLDRLVKSSIVQ